MEILITLLALIVLGMLAVLTVYVVRRIQSKIMRRRISNEGFETATDILYPKKRRTFRKYKMTPVLPG